MLKKELRLDYQFLRQQLSEEGLLQASRRIAAMCLELPVWGKMSFHLFLSAADRREVDTSFLLGLLRERGKRIVVPKMGPKGSLSHLLITEKTRLSPNRWGIPEPVAGKSVAPQTIDVVFVPLLAFDEKGYRVGYGGGYYDRFLSACRKDVVSVGLSFFGPVPEISDLHPGDVPLSYVVCPDRVYAF
ncbi:MAG TPA: 5-formyltetrahydrofolate cyclo-ligase [Robiginitalea sp.]|nr:5-formyltetrahydrofolate cyclo-ligase [Robiginitalea sp.]